MSQPSQPTASPPVQPGSGKGSTGSQDAGAMSSSKSTIAKSSSSAAGKANHKTVIPIVGTLSSGSLIKAGTSTTQGGASKQAASGAGSSAGHKARYEWMPSLKASNPSRECIRRVRNDIRSLMREPIQGLFVYPDEDLATVVHALVTGPFDTPYEGGFFYFILHCPDDYPHSPPRVRLMTTGGGTVRFNPNLYHTGKVCLSILGTWSGPRWTPVQSISSILLSIQSLMSDKPYHNEPGYEGAANPRDVQDYNDCIMHETLRVAVCSMVGDTSLWHSLPVCFQSLTRELFQSFLARYELVCEQNSHRDGEKMTDPFHQNRGIFRYAAIQRSIKQIAEMIQARANEQSEDVVQEGAQPAPQPLPEARTGSDVSPVLDESSKEPSSARANGGVKGSVTSPPAAHVAEDAASCIR